MEPGKKANAGQFKRYKFIRYRKTPETVQNIIDCTSLFKPKQDLKLKIKRERLEDEIDGGLERAEYSFQKQRKDFNYITPLPVKHIPRTATATAIAVNSSHKPEQEQPLEHLKQRDIQVNNIINRFIRYQHSIQHHLAQLKISELADFSKLQKSALPLLKKNHL